MNTKKAAAGIAELMPYVIRGARIGALAEHRITQTQFFLLVAVYSHGRCPMKQLAGQMSVSMPTASGVVERLVKAGYLKRVSASTDRRRVMVELSEKGNKLIVKMKKTIQSRWQTVLGVLDEKELEHFYTAVTKVSLALRERERRDV